MANPPVWREVNSAREKIWNKAGSSRKKSVKKAGRKPGRHRRTRAEQEALIAQMVRAGEERGYLRGVKEAEEKHKIQLADESLRVRLKLAEAYAEVFRSIANSANMLFDGGMMSLKER